MTTSSPMKDLKTRNKLSSVGAELIRKDTSSNFKHRRRSLPSYFEDFSTDCHCLACCSCSPNKRRQGACPAFTNIFSTLSNQKRSLDPFWCQKSESTKYYTFPTYRSANTKQPASKACAECGRTLQPQLPQTSREQNGKEGFCPFCVFHHHAKITKKTAPTTHCNEMATDIHSDHDMFGTTVRNSNESQDEQSPHSPGLQSVHFKRKSKVS